ALRDLAFKAGVVEGVVLHLDRHALDRGIEAGPLGNCPRLQRITHLQAEVVMPPAGMVELDDEDGARELPAGLAWLGLTGLVEAPLTPVLGQAHAVSAPPLAIALLHSGPDNGGSAGDE